MEEKLVNLDKNKIEKESEVSIMPDENDTKNTKCHSWYNSDKLRHEKKFHLSGFIPSISRFKHFSKECSMELNKLKNSIRRGKMNSSNIKPSIK